MIIVTTILHVIMCIILIAIVLLQTGKGASMGAAFGGGSNTLFGAAGPASFLNKLTTVAAVVFMITSFTLAVMSSRGTASSRVLDAPVQQEEPVEQTPTPSNTTEEPATGPATEDTVQEENTPTE
jgi:preprotein translocase subunit SecG